MIEPQGSAPDYAGMRERAEKWAARYGHGEQPWQTTILHPLARDVLALLDDRDSLQTRLDRAGALAKDRGDAIFNLKQRLDIEVAAREAAEREVRAQLAEKDATHKWAEEREAALRAELEEAENEIGLWKTANEDHFAGLVADRERAEAELEAAERAHAAVWKWAMERRDEYETLAAERDEWRRQFNEATSRGYIDALRAELEEAHSANAEMREALASATDRLSRIDGKVLLAIYDAQVIINDALAAHPEPQPSSERGNITLKPTAYGWEQVHPVAAPSDTEAER